MFGRQKKAGDAPAAAELTQPAESDATDTGQTIAAPFGVNDPAAVYAAEAHVAAQWKVGDVILDIYEVKHIHEGGGMGLVYRVHHRGWNIDLAVKSPRSDYFKTETQKENFTRECETWINLGLHPHIVSCHYVRTLGGMPRVFAEYVEGGTLKEWIDSQKLYEGGEQESLKRILDVAIQMAWGLHYAHEQGVIHQDVKPANVLMMPDGSAKITDFGLAKARAASGDPVVAGAGRSILVSSGGMTPAYCSPEQANKQELSRKTDIWSWAVSVLEMFVGDVCWQSGLVAPELLRRLNEVRVEGVEIPDLPEEWRQLLERCFVKEPGGRPENFIVVAERLKSLYHTIAGGDYTREYPEPVKIQADALNNRAVSMLDLGRAAEAETIFNRALSLEPGHPQATYNRGLHLWRTRRMTDGALVQALEESRNNRPDDWTIPYLAGWVHVERKDVEGAVKAFEAAEKLKGGLAVEQALAEARKREGLACQCVRSFEGHTKEVQSVALSADGRWALSGSWDNALRLWEVSSGKCLRTFEGHTKSVNSVALSADGRWALSGSQDNTLRLWEVSSGKCLRTFEGHTDWVSSVVLSADGRWALSGGQDNTLRLWEVSSGKCVRTFEGHTYRVNSVALSGDGRWALSGSDDTTIRLWEVSSGKCLRTFDGHSKWVQSVALSTDGRWALSGSGDRTLRLWDLGGLLGGFRSVVAPLVVCLSAGAAESLRVQKRFHVLLKGADEAFSGGDYAHAWSMVMATQELAGYRFSTEALDLAHQAGLRGRRTGFRGGLCRQTLEGHTDWVSSVALSSDGRWALSGSDDKTLRFWEVGSGKCLRTFEGHTELVESVALSADGRWALSGSRCGFPEGKDKTLKLWEVSSGKCLRTFEGHTYWVGSAALSPDGRWVLSGGRKLQMWEVSSGKCLRSFDGHTDFVRSIALSADGRWALSGSDDKTLRFWEVSSGNCLRTFEEHSGMECSVALSADGRWALSGRETHLRLWEVSSGKCLRTFEGHTNKLRSVAISQDGRWALSGSVDNTLRLWDLCSGRCVRTIEGHTKSISSVALSADGRWAFSGSGTHLRLWELEWDYEFPERKNWDEGARPHLEIFLTLHCAVGGDGVIRVGKPNWKDEDFQKLLTDLQYSGYGWLRPEGVRRELEKMTAEWQGPPKMPWE